MTRAGCTTFAAFCLTLLVCPLPILCQSEPAPPAALKVNVNLVLLPTHVSSTDGRPLSNLQKKDFRIFEDGVEQRVTTFAPVDSPADVALVMDVSRSTEPYLKMLKRAAQEFVDRMGPADRAALYTVGLNVIRVDGFTADRPAVRKAIGKLEVDGKPRGAAVLKAAKRGGTLLYDGLLLVQKEFSEENRRQVILVFTDTLDAGSLSSIEALKRITLQGSTMIFAVLPQKANDRATMLAQDSIAQSVNAWRSDMLRRGGKPPSGSFSEKKWAVVLDLSGAENGAQRETFQRVADEFLSRLEPKARVWVFDFRERLRPLLLASAAVSGKWRPYTPDEARGAVKLAGGKEVQDQPQGFDATDLDVEKLLVLSDVQQFGLTELLKHFLIDHEDVAVLYPKELSEPAAREEATQLMVFHPAGSMVMKLRRTQVWPEMEDRFEELSRDTGGNAFTIADAGELADIYARIAAQIRSSYTLGYYTSAVGHHALEVKVQDPTAVVHSRRAVIVQ